MKIKSFTVLTVFLSLVHLTVMATSLNCSTPGCKGVEEPVLILSNHQSNVMFPFGCYTGIDCPNGNLVSLSDKELLNLKTDITNPNGKTTAAQIPIQITQVDFENNVQVGKSIIFSQGYYDYFYMNIGIADAINAQTWTLPSNFAEYIDGNTSRYDILSPSQVPIALQVAGATHVLKEVISEPNDGEADMYMHLQIDGTQVTDLGSSFDFDKGSDDNFGSEPDVELYDVPLNLGDNQNTDEFPVDEVTNDNYLKINTATTVDAFGTIATPYGNFECLRQTEITKYFRRANGTASFGTTPNYEFRRVKWITKNGFVFSAAVQSENNSHVGLLGFVELTRFAPTNTLTSPSAVKINNDSHGVAINNTDFTAHESAVLDVESDSLGILIPRISKENRPKNPAEGLLIYQVDNTAGFYYFDGSNWRILGSSPSARLAVNESPKVGENQLENGSKFIKFDVLQENPQNLIIQIQPEGDCNGLYISEKTREGFWVKELQKGTSNVRFTYSINQK